MKFVSKLTLYVAASVLGAASIHAQAAVARLSDSESASPFPKPELVRVPAEDIFVPQGFDDNDNVQVIVQGLLYNTCYKAAPPIVNVDWVGRLITVSPQAYVYSSAWCLHVLVPVTQTIDLGILPAGRYRVVEYNTVGRMVNELTLPVVTSKSAAADDFLYAPVKQARVESGALGSQKTLVLSGVFGADCMEMQEVKVLHRTPNIVEVLPIAAYKAGSTCQPSLSPFEVRVTLPELAPGDTLIYVRSLNGQSISLVELF